MAAADEVSCADSAVNDDDAGGPSLRRYQPWLLADRLDLLDLPPSADGIEVDPPPDLLPYGEILQALTRCTFLKEDQLMQDAAAEYQVHKLLTQDDETLPGDSHSAAADDVLYSADYDIPYEEFAKDSRLLKSRRTPVDGSHKMAPEEQDEHELKRALYRIKALLLLKGKAIDKLDDAALESKYPRELILANSYFLAYHCHDAFGWCFDSDLCGIPALTDYQRLVMINCWDDHYTDWSCYRLLYSTPEADRDYLLYWKTITEKIKWIEEYMFLELSSREWVNAFRKASYQATRIATGFENINKDLALVAVQDFEWSTRLYVYHLKDLDGVFYEIWRRVKENVKEDCFTKALREVYDLKMFPSRNNCMEDEEKMAEQFHLCTAGITKEVPDPIARRLIAQQVRRKLVMTRGYEHYARKKLKVAEYIGLIGKAST